MKKHLSALILSGLMLVTSAQATDLECYAWTHNQASGAFERQLLKRSVIDANYFEAEISNYSFGADYSFLGQSGIGLIVYDMKRKRFTESTPGFRRIGDSRVRQADLKYYDQLDDQTIVAGVQCSYTEQ
jgi:hypothetical protein